MDKHHATHLGGEGLPPGLNPVGFQTHPLHLGGTPPKTPAHLGGTPPKTPVAISATLSVLRLLAVAALLLASASAHALVNEPTTAVTNQCLGAGGQGAVCALDTDCELNAYATLCVEHQLGDGASRRCEIPCEFGTGSNLAPLPALCAIGETCIGGTAMPGRSAHFCKPTQFSMDLNTLHQCVEHFVTGVQPFFGETNSCSLEQNLNRLLDQNGDSVFDIFDLDLCIKSYIERPSCALDDTNNTYTCDSSALLPCSQDSDCGASLFCDTARHICQRECGIIASRELLVDALDRQCTGALEACDYGRGRCQQVTLEGSTCAVDPDCPAGAYCFLGTCAPSCYRSVDCPDSRWSCAANNRCLALPDPEADGSFVFDPQEYITRFARASMNLDSIQNTDYTPLAIINVETRRQVVDNPSVSFGYRMMVTYDRKLDTQCLKPFVDCADDTQRDPAETSTACFARQSDCLIDDTEMWLRLPNPFGVITARGNPGISVDLDPVAADRLTPGRYSAKIRVIYDNGDSDSIPVYFSKVTPSGEYTGNLTVYMGGPENSLNGDRPLNVALKLQVKDTVLRWNELLAQYNIDVQQDIIDITQGQLVHATLHGNQSFSFTQGGATQFSENEIPFVGLYSPNLGRMRLIGLIDIAADFCIDENGNGCSDTTKIQARNPFKRHIRRQIEFFGPFDDSTKRFHGIYREKISGLAAPYDITLEGGFIFDQTIADNSDIAVAPLLPAGAAAVSFPSQGTLSTLVDADVAAYCGTDTVYSTAGYATSFSSQAAFSQYLQGATRLRGDLYRNSSAIFPKLENFNSAIEQALSALNTPSTADARAYLNIYDFLSSYVVPCDVNDPAPPPVCIDENRVRCGLALYQKAVINNWVGLEGVDTEVERGRLPLTCRDTIPNSGCVDVANGHESLFTLQEQQRFWTDLSQIIKFEGDRAQADAFYTLYRNEVNIFTVGTAIAYKEEQLRFAVKRYDELLDLIVAPVAGEMLFKWPMRAFAQVGNDWMKTMHVIQTDRMNALAELLDIERRLFMNTSDQNFVFAQHIMQHEYLTQVYLMSLKKHWQGDLFASNGEAAQIFERGQTVLNRLNQTKNPFGVIDGQVYFENSNTGVSNWQSFRDNLTTTLLPNAHTEVATAVVELQNSLKDVDAFEKKLYDSRNELDDTVADICGNLGANPCISVYQQYNALTAYDNSGTDLTQKTWAWIRDCKFSATPPANCPANFSQFTCTEFASNDHVLANAASEGNYADRNHNSCKEVVAGFVAGTNTIITGAGTTVATTSDPIAHPPVCKPDSHQVSIRVDGVSQSCNGGQMGALLQEFASLELQRATVLGSTETLARQINASLVAFQRTDTATTELNSSLRALNITAAAIDALVLVAEGVKAITATVGDAPHCLIIIGFAGGTDCAGSAISAFANSAGEMVYMGIKIALDVAKVAMTLAADEIQRDFDLTTGRWGAQLDAYQAARDVDGLIDEFNMVTQQMFNIAAQIEDLRFQAQYASDGYHDDVSFVASHLVGRESGNVLYGRQLVRQSAISFENALSETYKMVRAFIHRYNVTTGVAAALTNKVLTAITLSDIEAIVDDLNRWERQYCGAQAIDCDASNNSEVLRFSLRKTLFPNLRNIVDGVTGKVVTAGEQFHNIITNPPYVRRRVRGGLSVDQVELPFGVPLTLLENTPAGPKWLIDPLSCNHQLTNGAGTFPGNIAVNVVGRNLNEDPLFGASGSQVLRYEIVRGSMDFTRACNAESVVTELGTLPVLEYPIRKHIIGYAPQSLLAQEDNPPTYVSRSQPMSACLNQPEVSGEMVADSVGNAPACWRSFARDRSLSSLDWKFMLPISISDAATDNTWVIGDGLREDQRPIIDDIIFYFRYRSRPISGE